MGINGMGASINSLTNLIQLLRLHGIVVGENCQSSPTLGKIGVSIGTTMNKKVCDYIKTTKDPVVVLTDGSSDNCKLIFNFDCCVLEKYLLT